MKKLPSRRELKRTVLAWCTAWSSAVIWRQRDCGSVATALEIENDLGEVETS